MSTFLHRISHFSEVSYPLLDKGILSIGWSGCATSPQFMEQYKTGDYKQVYTQAMGGWGRNARSLYKFLIDMQIGDTVIVPSWGCFHVYKIISDVMTPKEIALNNLISWRKTEIIKKDDGFLYEGDNQVDLGFFRKVEIIKRDINRNQYAAAKLVSMMKWRGTTNQIDQLADQVTDAIARCKKQQPINISESIRADQEILEKVYKTILEQVSPANLERLISAYFSKVGASTEIHHTGDGGEGDADIIATFEQIRTLFYIQAKKHYGDLETKEWAVEQITAYRDRERKAETDVNYATVAMVISTARKFSDDCIQLARTEGVLLINGLEFSEMILGVGLYDFS